MNTYIWAFKQQINIFEGFLYKKLHEKITNMKRIILPIFLFLLGFSSFAQPITTNTTTYTVPQLVKDVLFASPSGGV